MKATNISRATCWNQLLTMMFGQLSNRESLRDLIVAMKAHAGKLYHLGIGKSVTRSNLSKANEQRDYRIFEEYTTFTIQRLCLRYHTNLECTTYSTADITISPTLIR